jgi:molybdenum cofactor sulfurtransferase
MLLNNASAKKNRVLAYDALTYDSLLIGTIYLDHAGTALYPSSLIEKFSDDLKLHLYGNPHSANPSSAASAEAIDLVRFM